ncbi:hypothetical protein AN958_09504, partial [Leucoagaricus sp. SymC.cos]
RQDESTMSLSKLLEDPFGPYPDQNILNPKWPRRGEIRPTLTSVLLRCNREDIGLDETELIHDASPTSRFVKHPVEVMGVLEIEKLDWLSETGRRWLEFDLRRRDVEMSIGRGSRLTLESVYGDGVNSGSTISVWVKFEKSMSAAYMTLNDDPTSLVLYAKDRHRSFRIATLDVRTMELSRNFIERYTIRRLIHQLIDGSDTPITGRNLDWLVNQYFAQVIPLDKNIRYIYNPNAAGIVLNSRGALKLKKPRNSRHVHKAEIRNVFARHAEWILADHIASHMSPQARYLDIRQWYQFVEQVKIVENWEKARTSGDWSLATVKVSVESVAHDLTKFGGTRDDWRRRLLNALTNPLHWQQKREVENQAQKVKPKPTIPTNHSSQPKKPSPPIGQLVQTPPSAKASSRPRGIPAIKYHYDNDFEEASTPPASDSDSQSDEESQELVDKLPWFCCIPPRLEASQHVWRCPGCRVYQIDLFSPDEDELEEIPENYADILRSRRWRKVTDPEVLTAFGFLVNKHYREDHLRDAGIELIMENTKVRSSAVCSPRCVHLYFYPNLGFCEKVAGS